MKHFVLALALLLFAGAVHAANRVEIFKGVTFKADGDLDNSTDVTIAAVSTGKRHCVTSVTLASLDANVDVNVRLLSDDTVIWRWGIDAVISQGVSTSFLIPVCTAFGEALEIDVAEDPTDNLITYSVQGFSE